MSGPSTLEDMTPEHMTLEELATQLEGRVVADPGSDDQRLIGIRALDRAGADELSFVHAKTYLAAAASSDAGAFLVPHALVEDATSLARPLIAVEDSTLAVARAIGAFHPRRWPSPGVHPTAVIGDGCDLHASVHIGPYAVIGDGSRIGAGVVIEAHCVIGRDCTVGDVSWLHPGVVLYDDTLLGERVEIHSGSVIGADGFGYATNSGRHHKVPQVGRAVLEDDVEVGANSAIDRAALEDTRIGAGSKIDNLVQVGHNVRTGRHCLLCGQSGIAGSTTLGDYVVLGGQSGVVDHATLGTGVQVAAKSAVYSSVEDGQQVGGIPAVPLPTYRRQVAKIAKLDSMAKRLRRLEKRLDALDAKGDARE